MYGQYSDEMRMMSFKETINDVISDKLDEMEGSSVYGSDLSSEISMEDNINGTMFVYTQDARDFINDHPEQAAETFEYFKDMGISINPYENPDTYSFYMESYGVDQVISSSNYIQQHWSESITLTPEVIKQIKEDLGIETQQTQDIETLYGYVYDNNNMHGEPVLFESDPENISLFIMNNQDHHTVITDSMDSFVVSSMPGGFLDRVSDPETREKILENLLPYQQYETVPITFPVEESYFTIGDKTVHVQFNSDRDFDYTIYDRNMDEIDGGIVDNSRHLDSVPSSLLETIKDMHKLDGDISLSEIHSLEHDEAISRMETLRLKEDIIEDFKNGELWQSTNDGELYHLSDDQDFRVSQLEEKYDCTVYHVIHDDYIMSDGTRMEMESYLYVSDSLSEWKEDRELLLEGHAYGYVYNNTYPDFSEIGDIGFAPRDGGLIRNDTGYDFNIMSAKDLTDKIDQYRFHSDPLGYVEREFYEGANRDQIFTEVRSNCLDNERSFFRNEIESNQPMSPQAREIMSDIDAYSKDFDLHVDDGMDLKGGMSL